MPGVAGDSPGAAGWEMAFDKLVAHAEAHSHRYRRSSRTRYADLGFEPALARRDGKSAAPDSADSFPDAPR